VPPAALSARITLSSLTVSVELFHSEGDTTRTVTATIDEHAFRIATQDVGSSVQASYGDSDYEFWTSVPTEAWGKLLVAMAIELYSGKRDATDQLADLCQRHDIAHIWDRWV
jgi:hypothetical protein